MQLGLGWPTIKTVVQQMKDEKASLNTNWHLVTIEALNFSVYATSFDCWEKKNLQVGTIIGVSR